MDCDLRNDDKEVCLCIVNAAIEVGKGARHALAVARLGSATLHATSRDLSLPSPIALLARALLAVKAEPGYRRTRAAHVLYLCGLDSRELARAAQHGVE